MKRAMFFLVAAGLIVVAGASSLSKEKHVPRPRFYRPVVKESVPDIPGYEPRASIIAAVDTYCIASYDFEQVNWQGWTRIDNTAQKGTFFHVDDFAGLGGGSHGRLVPVEGTKSMWCGIKPGTGFEDYLCSWEAGPGYGNNWGQKLQAWVQEEVLVDFSYHLVCDTEEGIDVVTVGWEMNDYTVLATYSGTVDTVASHNMYIPFAGGWGAYLFFKFWSDGSISDEDGAIDTDGAVLIDSITIKYDGRLSDYEDFESYDPGETYAGRWTGYPADMYGRYSGLTNNLVDHDPCAVNIATVIMFFVGSYYPSSEYPGQYNTPFCTGQSGLNDPCQDEIVASPWLDLRRYSAYCDENQDSDIPPGELGDMGGYMLSYSAYLDNPVENLVFHTW